MGLKFFRTPHGKSQPLRIIFLGVVPFVEGAEPKLSVEKHTVKAAIARFVRIKNCAVNTDIAKRLYCPADFWQFVYSHCDKQANTWIFCNRASYEYTMIGLWDEIDSGRLHVELKKRRKGFLCLNDVPFIAKLSTPCGRNLIFVDVRNHVNYPIRKLAEFTGIRLPQYPNWFDSDDDWFAYCVAVTDIIGTAMLRIIKLCSDRKLGGLKYTVASQSISALGYRHKSDLICIHENYAVKQIEREAYFGGMNRVQYLGSFECELHELDCTMQYAAIMRDNPLPRRMIAYCNADIARTGCPAEPYGNLIARVRIKSASRVYPVRAAPPLHDGIPWRFDSRLSAVYAMGQFETVLCGPELAVAVENNHVTHWIEWIRYEMGYSLRQFAGEMIDVRNELLANGDKLGEKYVKNITNCLHGKLAGKAVNWTDIQYDAPHKRWGIFVDVDADNGEINMLRSVGGNVQLLCQGGEIANSNIAIAAFITAYGRVQMQQYMDIAGFVNTYYVTADALYVTEWGKEFLERKQCIADNVPGKLRHKHSGTGGIIRGIGDMTVGTRSIKSGYSSNARELDFGIWADKVHRAVSDIVRNKPPAYAEVNNIRKLHNRKMSLGVLTMLNRVRPYIIGEQDNEQARCT